MPPSQCSECGAPILSLSAEGPDESILDVRVAPRTLARHIELMNTNAPPEGAELTFIRAVVAKTDARLADVENEISRLRDRLQQLEDERTSLGRYQASNKVVLSPLRRMPLEVLAEIFSWTLPSLDDALTRRKFDRSHSPWVLTQVSSRWRAVALSAPSLWSLIVINGSDLNANSLSMVKTHVERARQLKIYFFGSKRKPPNRQIDLFQFLSEHSAQWEELRIRVTSDIAPLLVILRNRLPSLRRAWIQWKSAEDQTGVQSIDCFQTASALIEIGVFNQYHYVPILLPAQQLTRYCLDAPWNVHAGILELSQSLVEAHIVVNFEDETWPENEDIVNLMCLLRLYISNTRILNYLRTPALQEITAEVRENDEPIHRLRPFLVRSSCNLRRLCLYGTPGADATTEILLTAPSIVELGILIDQPEGRGEVAPLMSHLMHISGSTPVAPRLRHLFFGCEENSSMDYELYLKMLQSRWKAAGYALEAASLLWESGPGVGAGTDFCDTRWVGCASPGRVGSFVTGRRRCKGYYGALEILGFPLVVQYVTYIQR
ncbi:hypothetical protein FB451DRAFT_1552531 [Mycena latifolia]|nr:hypothetical protein FB451DRAFT_1552531 [Mycena latifolia]